MRTFWLGLVLALLSVGTIVQAVDPITYHETWRAVRYREARVVLYPPGEGVNSGALRIKPGQSTYVSPPVCLGVAAWEVTTEIDGQAITEYWSTEDSADYWQNTPIDYLVMGANISGNRINPNRLVQVVYRTSDSEVCANKNGLWVDQRWALLFCSWDGVCVDYNQRLADRYYLTPLGQYALVAQFGQQTTDDTGTLGADVLYPFNLQSTPKKWHVVLSVN